MNNNLWMPQGETKIFDKDKHLIWIISEYLEDIETPEGYRIIKIDKTNIKHKEYAIVFFKNNVPVKAELYKNKKTKEISYYFAGEIIENVKVKTIKLK